MCEISAMHEVIGKVCDKIKFIQYAHKITRITLILPQGIENASRCLMIENGFYV
jgi:hypothetical protein